MRRLIRIFSLALGYKKQATFLPSVRRDLTLASFYDIEKFDQDNTSSSQTPPMPPPAMPPKTLS